MAEHDLNKIVDDDGEVYNLRDSTKQPVADRVTAWSSTPSDTKYPSEKLVKDTFDKHLAYFDATYIRNNADGSGWVKLADIDSTQRSYQDINGVWDVVLVTAASGIWRESITLDVRFNGPGSPQVILFNRIAELTHRSSFNFCTKVVGLAGSGNSTVELWAYVTKGWYSIGIREAGADNLYARKRWTYYSYSTNGGSAKPVADAGNNIQVVDPTYVDNDYRTILQDVSKGANLVVNGAGTMCTNYNWPSWTWVGDYATNASAGAFRRSYDGNDNAFCGCTEYIAINPNRKIDVSVDVNVLSELVACTIRMTIGFYDIDKNAINAQDIMYGTGTCTTLAQDLNPGDTVVYLTSVANWTTDIGQDYKRGFIFWDYSNSYGYVYPPETYSRNHYTNWFDNAASINSTNNTITLNKAWTGPAKTAGTKVSKCDSGGTYNYLDQKAVATTEVGTWFHLHAVVNGMSTVGTNPNDKIRQGTAFVKIGFLNSTSNANYTYVFTNYRVYEIPESAEKLLAARKLAVSLSNTSTDTSFDGSADVTNIKVSGTLPISNGGTGQTTANNAANALLSGLPSWTANPTDSVKLIRRDTGGSSTFGQVTFLTVWNYIKSKISSVLGLSENNGVKTFTGNADTATTAQNFDTSTGTIKTALDGKEDKANKVTTVRASSSATDTAYPSEKAVASALSEKASKQVRLSFALAAAPSGGVSTKYVKIYAAGGDYRHWECSYNGTTGSLYAAWLFRSYSTGENSRDNVTLLKSIDSVTRAWYSVGASTWYVKFEHASTSSQQMTFNVAALDTSALPTLEAVDTLPSGATELTVNGVTMAEKLVTARQLAVDLSNTSTNTSFNGTANVTNIKTTGILGVANGGTGNSSVDTTPTASSTKMVTSGGIYNALDLKEDKSNKVTSVRASSSATDTAYPSEKAVATALEAKAPSAVTTEVTIANGDKMIIADASDSSKLKRASVAFDGSSIGVLLSKKGTFEQPKEAYLTWGGKNFSASYGPIDAAMVSQLGACRTAFGKAAGVVIEYTRDGGTTWTDYGAADSTKIGLFTTSASVTLGKCDSTNKATAGDNWQTYKTRIRIHSPAFGLYTNLNKFVILVATTGSVGCQVTIRTMSRTQEEGSQTWVTQATAPVSGWSGYNVVNVSGITTWSGSSDQKSQSSIIEFLFEATQPSTSSTYNGLVISSIYGYGGVGWTTPSTMAKTGHLYSYDTSQNATFPANISASGATLTNPLAIAYGGTGATTAKGASYNINAGMNSGDSDAIVDTSRFAFNYANPTVTSGGLYYRTAPKVWDWIKGKLTSVSGVNISGNAATATDLAANSVLSVSKGGTGKSSVTSNSFLVGNGTSALVEKTPSEVLSLIGGQAALTEMTTQEVTDFVAALGEL